MPRRAGNNSGNALDLAATMGGKNQSLPDGLKEEETPLGSDELLNELIATQQREVDFEDQLEKDILLDVAVEQQQQQHTSASGNAPAGGTGGGTGGQGGEPATDQPPVLVPVLSRDIKADVALPRRGKKLRRSRTSSLAEADDARMRELAHAIPPVLATDDVREMSQRFSDKLQQCSMPLDVIVKYNPAGGETVRRSTLEELVEVIEGSEQARFLTNEYLPDLLRLVKANVFRDLPQCPRILAFEACDPDNVVNPEWDCLNNVYKVAFRVLCHQFPDPSVLSRLWNRKAMLKLVNLILDNSIDARERRFAKIILHRSYAKIRALRDVIRTAIGHALADFVCEPEARPRKGPAGIAELLEIYASLVQGFKFPVKQEHVTFVRRYVLPLHKAPLLYFSWYRESLLDCLKHLVNKQPTLAEPILDYMFKYWPWLDHKKQIALLEFVEAVTENVWLQTKVIKAVTPKLLAFLRRLLATRNYTVIEHSFALWENDHLVTAIWEASNKLAMEALRDRLKALGAEDVWSLEVRYNSAGVLELLEDLSTMGL